MDDRLIKGIFLAPMLAFIEESYAEAGQLDVILGEATPEARAAFQDIKRTEWYPLRFGISLMRGIRKVEKDEATFNATLLRCGNYMGKDATSTFMALLMKVLTMKMFISKLPKFWEQYHDFGPARVDTSELDARRVSVSVPGYDYVHVLGAGWLEHMLRSLGKPKGKVGWSCPPGEISAPEVRWDLSW